MIGGLFARAQIYDQIYYENFERAKKEAEERAREEAKQAQQAAWAAMGPPGGPPGLPGWEGQPQSPCCFPLCFCSPLFPVFCRSMLLARVSRTSQPASSKQ